jgi:hypothetical protein
VRELSLTAARARADLPPRQPWDTEPLPAPPSSRTGLWSGAWGDAAAAGAGGTGRGAGAGAGEDVYDVWDHPGDAPPVFELYPMEIRTFEVEFEA